MRPITKGAAIALCLFSSSDEKWRRERAAPQVRHGRLRVCNDALAFPDCGFRWNIDIANESPGVFVKALRVFWRRATGKMSILEGWLS